MVFLIKSPLFPQIKINAINIFFKKKAIHSLFFYFQIEKKKAYFLCF